MVAIASRYQVRWFRVPKAHWWWIRPRYELFIPIEHRASLRDFQIRSDVARVSSWHGYPKYGMEILDGEYSGKLTVR